MTHANRLAADLQRSDPGADVRTDSERALALFEECVRGAPSIDAMIWMRDGFRDHMNTGKTLEQALGLAPRRGEHSARLRIARIRMRTALFDAWKALRNGRASDWACTVLLCKEISSFKTEIYPGWRARGGPPATVSELRSALYAAFDSGVDVPETADEVHKVVMKATR